jgi:hypothetical protein
MHLYFVGLDVHKQTIAFCIKAADGKIVKEGTGRANRSALSEWAKTVPGPWVAGMESTMFSHWIYYHLKRQGVDVSMGHAARMKAISAVPGLHAGSTAAMADGTRASQCPAPQQGGHCGACRACRDAKETAVSYAKH